MGVATEDTFLVYNTSSVIITEIALPYRAIHLTLNHILSYTWPCVVLFGIVTNIINIFVFLKTGAKDNVTILLIALSMSDLTYLTLISTQIAGYVIHFIVRPTSLQFDSRLLLRLLFWPAYTAYDLSTYISVSLGVMRCACVAMPLKFKLVFTKSRTIVWLLCLVVLAVMLRLPVLMVHSVGRRINPVTNVSAPYLQIKNRDAMYKVLDILNRGIIVNVAYITMISCVCILSFKLYQSSKIRRPSSIAKGPQGNGQTTSNRPHTVTQGLSPKDLQVVKSVVLVCTIFVLAQLPNVILSTSRRISSAIDHGGRLVYLFAIFTSVNQTCTYLNASINIFVYYNYNSKYRAALHSLFQLQKRL
ncbi:chemosensory receptor A [Elysia marginata]|uniref:Chemosensory receptor A n=1 Tax=Elysia marginata TaxID=1093978 RepID=A0AAV4G1I0_9GAST|nr:chemosensory receptor A [Elysia marginata]